MISWTQGRLEEEVLATRSASRGDLNHNDSEMVYRILAGWANVASVLKVVSCYSNLCGLTVKCVKTNNKNSIN